MSSDSNFSDCFRASEGDLAAGQQQQQVPGGHHQAGEAGDGGWVHSVKQGDRASIISTLRGPACILHLLRLKPLRLLTVLIKEIYLRGNLSRHVKTQPQQDEHL